jgi:hypothetical protein
LLRRSLEEVAKQLEVGEGLREQEQVEEAMVP